MDKNLNKSKTKYGVIYLIRNKTNNKLYFGQTVHTFKSRYGGNLKKFTHNEHLKNSIYKYGEENFEIIEEFDIAYSKEELDKLEDMYIKLYNTTDGNFGYNKMYGGSNGLHTEEVKEKMRKQKAKESGKKVICITTNMVFDSIGEAGRYYNISSSTVSSCCSSRGVSTVRVDGEKLQWLYYEDYLNGVKVPKVEDDRVICVTTGEIFVNMTQAANKYYNGCSTGIYNCCNMIFAGSTNCFGEKLQWLYYEDYLNGVKPLEIKDYSVICVTTGEVFENAPKAARHYNMDSSHIYENCRKESKYAGTLEDNTKLQWLFYNDYLNGVKQVDIRDDRVVCVNTGEVFANAGEAARKYGLDRSGINKVCKGVRKSRGKLDDGTPLVWKRFVDYIEEENSEIVA